VEQRILVSVKKVLNLPESDTSFDLDITMHINSALMRLKQLGVGPSEGFMIEDATDTWDAFVGDDPRWNQVRTYVYMAVRLVWDPPSTPVALASMERQVDKLEWLLNVEREEMIWQPPVVVSEPSS
jgi:hypothetical protein